MGRDSSVGIATDYGLHGPGIEFRLGARFSAPVQTGPGAHPASCTMGTWSFPGVKSGRSVTLTAHPLLVPWSRKSTAILLLLAYADDVNILGGNIHTLKENEEALVAATREIGLEVSTDQTKYMIMSRDQNAGRNHSVRTDNITFERVEAFK